MTSFDPKRPDFAPYGFTCVRWHPSRMPRPDRHNEIEINLLRSGSLTYLLGGRKVHIPARQLSVFWAAVPHQIIQFENTTEYFVATLPLAWFIQCRLPEKLVQPLLHGEVVAEPNTHRAEGDLELMEHWDEDLSDQRSNLRKAVLLELEARLLRLANSLVPEVRGAGGAIARPEPFGAHESRADGLSDRTALHPASHGHGDQWLRRAASQLRDEPFQAQHRHHHRRLHHQAPRLACAATSRDDECKDR